MDSCLLASSGVFTESDELSLSVGLHVDGVVLSDGATGARHRLEPRAARLIAMLEGGVQGALWLKKSHQLGINGDELEQILVFLNTIAGLSIRRRHITSVARCTYRIKAVLYRLSKRTLAVRGGADLQSIVYMMLTAVWPVVVASFLVAALLYGAGLHNGYELAILYVQFNITIVVTLILHEYMHSLVASNQKERVFIKRGLRVGILHKTMSDRDELLSTLLGPLSGMALSYFMALISGIFIGSEALIVGYICMAFHLSSWLPWYGDGRQLVKIVSHRR